MAVKFLSIMDRKGSRLYPRTWRAKPYDQPENEELQASHGAGVLTRKPRSATQWTYFGPHFNDETSVRSPKKARV